MIDNSISINYYYDNNARRLRSMVDKIVARFGGISNKDMQDFYSVANEVFVECLERFSKDQGDFHPYLAICLENGIMTEITRRNREKRTTDRESVSLDAPLDADGEMSLRDIIIDSRVDIENEIIEKLNPTVEKLSDRMKNYINSLPKKVQKLCGLIMNGHSEKEIMDILDISYKDLYEMLEDMRRYENVKILLS